MVTSAEKEVKDIEKQYNSGLLTSGERYNKVVDIWSHTNDQVSQAMMKDLARQARKMRPGTWLISLQPFSPESLDEADVSADASAQGTSTEAK